MAISTYEGVVLAAFLALIVRGIHGHYTSEVARIRRALRGVRRSDVATAPEGRMTKVVGVIDYVGEPLRAPISGRPCAGYEVTVWLEGKNGGDRILRDAAQTDFWLNDGTGTALIRMKDARSQIHWDTTKKSGPFNAPTPELEAFLRRHGQASTDEAFGVSFNRALRYEEGVLEGGEKVAALGYATRQEDVSPGAAPGDSRYGRSRRLVLQAKGDEAPLCVSDEPDVLR